MALKSKKDEPKDGSDSEDEDDDEDDPFAIITRGLARILKMKKQFNKDGSESSKFRGKSQYNKFDKKTKPLSYFECGETDHLVKDCPQNTKRQSKKGDKWKKKAMVAT